MATPLPGSGDWNTLRNVLGVKNISTGSPVWVSPCSKSLTTNLYVDESKALLSINEKLAWVVFLWFIWNVFKSVPPEFWMAYVTVASPVWRASIDAWIVNTTPLDEGEVVGWYISVPRLKLAESPSIDAVLKVIVEGVDVNLV